MRIRVDTSGMKDARRIMQDLGVDRQGHVQQFLTERVKFRMGPYMPWDTGFTAKSLTQVTSPTSITVSAPYAQYLYNGVSKSGNALEYTKTNNPQAGPFWDQTLMQNEGDAIAEEVAAYARSIND